MTCSGARIVQTQFLGGTRRRAAPCQCTEFSLPAAKSALQVFDLRAAITACSRCTCLVPNSPCTPPCTRAVSPSAPCSPMRWASSAPTTCGCSTAAARQLRLAHGVRPVPGHHAVGPVRPRRSGVDAGHHPPGKAVARRHRAWWSAGLSAATTARRPLPSPAVAGSRASSGR